MLVKAALQTKLFLVYSLIVIILLTVVASIFYFYTYRSFESKAKENLVQLADKTAEQFNFDVLNMDRITLQLVYNDYVRSVLDGSNTVISEDNYFDTDLVATRKLRSTIVSINTMAPMATRITLLNLKGDWLSAGEYQGTITKKEILDMDWYKEALSLDGKLLLKPVRNDYLSESGKHPVFSVSRSIKYGHVLYGVVEVQMNASVLDELCSLTKDIQVEIYDGEGNITYPYTGSFSGSVYDRGALGKLLKNTSKGAIQAANPINGQKEILYAKYLLENWCIVFSVPVDKAFKSLFLFRNVAIAVWLLLIALTLSIIYISTKSITSPVRRLRNSIANMNYKEFHVELDMSHNNNEIALLNRAFEEMLQQLKQYSEITIEAKAREIKAHFQALQSQINPHFLYNTLAAISIAGQENGNEKVMRMCSQLSRMLRYISSTKHMVTDIYAEAEYVRNYLELLKSRMEEKLQYEICIPEEMNTIKVPKLILQPLVENSVSHGFKNTRPPWNIKIYGMLEENKWIVNIKDNGNGFDKEALTMIETQKENYRMNAGKGGVSTELKSEGLGLINTYARIYMLYGNDARLDIQNADAGGAIVSIAGRAEGISVLEAFKND